MFDKTTTGEWVTICLSIIYAILATFSKPINESGTFIAGTFIGSFIGSLIILYIFYWIITKVFPKSNDWGIISWILAIIGIPLVVIIILAVIVAFIFGMAGSSTAPVQTIEEISYQPVQTIAPLGTIVPVKIAPKPTLIDYSGKSGWVQYTNYEDHFSIYKPTDWATEELTMAELSELLSTGDANKIDKTTMNQVVYIYSPSYTGYITIYGIDYSGTLVSIFNDPGKTQISDELYDSAVSSFESSSTASSKDKTIQAEIASVEKDSNYYMINGNPARRMVINWLINGKSLSGESYIIAHDNAYYVELYSAMVGSSQSDAATASNIMRTFTTNA